MAKFFYPCGKEIPSQNEFIEFYIKKYYLKEDGSDNCPLTYKITKGCRKVGQSSRYVEGIIDSILRNGIKSCDDLTNVIAWKIGSIKHKESTKGKIVYYDKNNPTKTWHGAPILIDGEDGLFCKVESVRNVWETKPTKALEMLKEQDGIGPVYAITILYFLSQGEYPIYDQFAHFALMGIKCGESPEKRKFTDKDREKEIDMVNITKKNSLTDIFNNYIEHYIDRLNCIFKDQWKHDRDVDRALWVYGHLYKRHEK